MFFGVRDEEKRWFQAYLENRLQRVISGHSSSSWLVHRLGVPQGSILGLLLFVMFVNDVDYCCVVWDRCSKRLQTKVETIQIWGMRYILKSPWSTAGAELREKLGWTTLSHRRNLLTLKTIHKCIHKRGPTYLHEKFIKQSDMANSKELEEPPNFIYIGQKQTYIRTLLNTLVLSYGTPYLLHLHLCELETCT